MRTSCCRGLRRGDLTGPCGLVVARLGCPSSLVNLDTDDPALSHLTLAAEYRTVAAAFGWDFIQMVSIAHDGVDACWLDQTTKNALHDRINTAAHELAPQPPT